MSSEISALSYGACWPSVAPAGSRSVLATFTALLAAVAGIAVLLYAGFSIFVFAAALLGVGLLLARVISAGRNSTTLLLAFSLRLLAAVALSLLLTAETGGPYIGGDDFDFDSSGRQLAAAWRSGQYGYQLEFRADREVDNAYNYVVAAAYVVSGWLGAEDNSFAALAVNCLAGALLAVTAGTLAREQWGADAGRRAAALTVFAPDLLLYSAVGLRDILLALLIVFFVLCLGRLAAGRGSLLTTAAAVAAGFVAVTGMRRELLAVLLALLVANLAVQILPSAEVPAAQRRRARRLFLLAVIPGALLLAPVLRAGLESLLDPAQRYLTFFDKNAASGSLGILLYRLPWLLRGPALFANLMALPFPPWMYLAGGASGGWASVYLLLNAEVPFWYLAAPFSIIGGLWCFRAGRVRYFPLYGSTGLLLAAMSFGGAVDTRWRTMAMPLLLVLAAAGWQHRREFPKIVPGWTLAMAAAVVAYLALKA